jgi:hypothetical protein
MSDPPQASRLGSHGGKRVKGEQACTTRLVYGTVDYWLRRLEREQRYDLIEAIRQREVSAHAVACQLGWVRRRRTGVIDGDHNLTRVREFAMQKVLERSAPAFTCEIPCFSCSHLNSWQALREIATAYAAMQRGEGPSRRSTNGALPQSCCQRQMRPDVKAMIG